MQRNKISAPILMCGVSLQVLLENLLVVLDSYNILLLGKYLVLGNFSGRNIFSKIVALIV